MLANQRHDTRGLAGHTFTTPHLRCLASPLTVFSRGPFSLVACSCNQFTGRLTWGPGRGTDPLDLSARLVCKSGPLEVPCAAEFAPYHKHSRVRLVRAATEATGVSDVSDVS
jgi:hypothetical protein